ncbi:secretion/DNA translocation related CpaE-like protein [Murinocardiopsis flavida]|uniref:Secretion/DNA translocation related CpaE-like protein n=1 Tax=Murinocardiopsis flavida TaxID=645275 RepID=A0A2P8DQF6_9ACTN|nr:septum site-determining protein Ssd [Murinocardiopsis flavida]PSK99424.1 secretion/DNA translocation related CpaE-like protein [Murinocardiopsis flavida]
MASTARPLIVTDDPDLLDDLLRLAAAADVEVTVAGTAAQAGREWPRAPLAVVGADLLARLAALEPDRHPNAVVIGGGADAEPADGRGGIWDAALRIGAREVLALPESEAHLAELFAEATEERRARAAVISVVGGKGGAGASLFAVAFALAGERSGRRTALVDIDPLGGGLDLLIGGDHIGGARWGDFAGRAGRMHWPALRRAFPRVNDLTVVTWAREAAAPLPAPAVRAVLASAARGTDLVVCDLPRTLDPCAEEALLRSTRTLLVVPADVHAVMAARRITPGLRRRVADLRVAVRAPHEELPAETVATALDLPLAGSFAAEPRLAACLDRGRTPATDPESPLASFCTALLTTLDAPPVRDDQQP